jgi:hypothetical protein
MGRVCLERKGFRDGVCWPGSDLLRGPAQIVPHCAYPLTAAFSGGCARWGLPRVRMTRWSQLTCDGSPDGPS